MYSKIIEDINENTPCGIDAKYEDSFALIEQEIDKDTSVTSDRRTDWDIVVKDSYEFLESTSKDLKISTWWLYGMWKTKSWSGLNAGLDMYVQMLEKYQKNIFPSSVKIKANVFMWLELKLGDEILASRNDLQYETKLYENFVKLNDVIQILLEKDEKYFGKVIRLLEPLVKAKEKKSQEKEEAPKVTTSSESSINEITNNNDATKVLSDLKKNASNLSKYYREANFKDIVALKICRFLSFLDVDGIPYNTNNVTIINPPLITEIDEVIELTNNSMFRDAFILIEEILEVCPFWFDGHLRAYEIMLTLNEDHLAQEIKNTFMGFIATNTELLDVSFKDNTSFASPKVKKWIAQESQSGSSSNSNDNTSSINESILNEVNELASNNKIIQAMQILQSSYLESKNMEEKFNWRLHHAKLAIEFDKKDIALALLEGLENTIEKYKLEEWNPTLSSEVFYLILDTYTNMDIDSEKLELLYKKLCKIDVEKALKIKI